MKLCPRFAVGLIPFEIVNGGADELAGFLVGADRVNHMANHQKSLEGNHHLIVFNIIANEKENRFLRHGGLQSSVMLHLSWRCRNHNSG